MRANETLLALGGRSRHDIENRQEKLIALGRDP
jgi:hypothetical protein